MKCTIVRVPCGSPSDMKPMKEFVEKGLIVPSDVIAVLGKTEGNGCVNDFTRGYAVHALKEFYTGWIGAEKAARISFIMSGGTEGILSPHFTVISRGQTGGDSQTGQAAGRHKSLAIGVAHTPALPPEAIGRKTQVIQVAEAVRRAMNDAGIEDASDVHFVQIKCPLLTAPSIREAESRGATAVTDDTYKSMGFSRGASALGVAVALKEIHESELKEEDICHSWHKFSSVASTSAGSELDYCEIILFGNSGSAQGDLFIEHDVMKDSIDGAALRRLMELNKEGELVQVLAKAEAAPSGYIRERRHTMLDDSDINHTRHARAVVGGVLASVCGDPMIYVSGGAEHQGPAGGGPVAAVFRRKK
jgi:cyanuric acid amidohydrolase